MPFTIASLMYCASRCVPRSVGLSGAQWGSVGLSGAEGFVDFEDYGLAKEHWLRERLGLELPHGIPSHNTFNRLFSLLDAKAFEACFMVWTQHLQQITEGEILAIDGKSVRRSFDSATG